MTNTPPTAATLISQELFDEAVIDNEETFDLPPEEALVETIDQFCQQLGVKSPVSNDISNDINNPSIDNNDGVASLTTPSDDLMGSIDSNILNHPALSHLVLSHPDSEDGKRIRSNRTKFQNCLDLLDGCIGSDGKLKIDDILHGKLEVGHETNGIRNAEGPSGGAVGNEEVSAALDEIAKRCQFGDGWNPQSSENAVEHLTEENGDQTRQPPSSPEKNTSSSFPYLAIFQRTSSIYTLMSFLGAVDPTALGNMNVNSSMFVISNQILQGTIHALFSILSSNSSNTFTTQIDAVRCLTLRAELRDLFVPALGRVVALLGGYLIYFKQLQTCAGESRSSETEKFIESAQNVLMDLLRLGTYATRGCEAGKVAFVQSTILTSLLDNQQNESAEATQAQRGGVKVLISCLSAMSSSSERVEASTTNILTETCQLLSSLCRCDDFRDPSSTSSMAGTTMGAANVSVSSAHDHAMEFHRAGAVTLLVRIARDVLTLLSENQIDLEPEFCAANEKLASAVLTSLRVLAVNDEIIQTMVALGVLPIVTNALKLGVTFADDDSFDDKKESAANEGSYEGQSAQNSRTSIIRKQRITSASLGLLRNLCGNDEIKTNLCLGSSSTEQKSSSISSTPSILPFLIKAMQSFPTIPQIQEHACGTLAAMALRRPANARAIIDAEGPRLILLAMKRHEMNVNLQRQGALAIRNIISRLLKGLASEEGSSPTAVAEGGSSEFDDRTSIRDIFLELGAEEVLRNIAGRHQGSVDEAYAALRDLGCSVSLLKFGADDLEQRSQVGVQRTMMFGEKHNSNFRAVYEESAGLAKGVDEAVSQFGA